MTRRYNGLYLVSAFKPVVRDVLGTGHKDAYIKYGDPVGYINVSYEFAVRTFDNPPELHVQPRRGTLYGCLHKEPTHILVYDDKTRLYYIYKTHECYINNICEWFVTKMFGITELRKPQPVYFAGKI